MEGRCVGMGQVNILISTLIQKGNPALRISAVSKDCKREISYPIDSTSFNVEEWASANLTAGYTIETKDNLRVLHYSYTDPEGAYIFSPILRMGRVNNVEVPLTIGKLINADNPDMLNALINSIRPAIVYFTSVIPTLVTTAIEQQNTGVEKARILLDRLANNVTAILG